MEPNQCMEHSRLEERTDNLQEEMRELKATLRKVIYLILAVLLEVPITGVM